MSGILNGNVTGNGRFVFGPDIVTNGLILYFDAANKFSYSGTGTSWVDISGNGNTGTLLNGPTFNSENAGGLVFDGINEYVNLLFTNPKEETIIVWTKSNTSTWNNFGFISSSRAQNGHIIHPNQGTTTVDFYILNSGGGYTQIGGVTPSQIMTPNMYSITTNGSNSHKCYLNGVLRGTSTTSITRTSTPSIAGYVVAKDDYYSRYGNATFYLVMRYNRELSSQEILQNYNSMKGRFGIL